MLALNQYRGDQDAADSGGGENPATSTSVGVNVVDNRIPIYRPLSEGGTAVEGTITVTATPADKIQNVTVVISKAGGGAGDATFDNGRTSKIVAVKGSASVRIRGTVNSSIKENMMVTAWLRGKKAEKKFSVRTWPTNLRWNGPHQKKPNAVLLTEYVWDSESGNIFDLQPDLYVGEVVTYNTPLPTPPYKAPLPQNPTVGAAPGTLGIIPDANGHPGFSTPYVADVNTAIQNLGFWDVVLDGPINLTTGANQHVLLGPISITRTVSTNGVVWIYKIEKLGVNNFMTLP